MKAQRQRKYEEHGTRHKARWIFRGELWLVLVMSLFGVSMDAPPQQITAREYQLKAAFLFNFTQFVEWPAEAFAQDDSPLVIGILGEDPFGSYLDDIVQGEKLNNHPLVVRRYAKVEDIKECHILFINAKGKGLKDVLDNLKSTSTLTVSDVDSFVKSGGMVRFFTEDNKLRIRIGLDPIKEARLVVSSKLLRLAEVK
jgi:hypothetical protein